MMAAQRRCLHSLIRHSTAARFSLTSTQSVNHYHTLKPHPFTSPSISHPINNPLTSFISYHRLNRFNCSYNFSSSSRSGDDEKDDNEDVVDDDDDSEIDDDDSEIDDDDYDSEDEDEDEDTASYTAEQKEAAAEAVGYKVVGPLKEEEMDKVFQPYQPIFAVVQIGSHQFKVSNGDYIFAEKLKFCDVNDKLILNKVLLLGSENQTIIGRPIVPEAAVHAVVEEHALDAKVIIFKKKRRKNYRRKNGHRQELTKLRITDIQGISKPENKVDRKPTKSVFKKPIPDCKIRGKKKFAIKKREKDAAKKPEKLAAEKLEKVAAPA